MAYNDGWIVPLAGIYHVTYSIMSASSVPVVVGITKNGGGVSGDVLIAGSSGANTGAVLATSSADVPLVAGDILRLWAFGNAGVANFAPNTGPIFSIFYTAPPR
jgi:hypothetical protein